MASFLIKLTLGALILLAYAAHSSPLGTFKKDSFMDSAWKFGQEHMLKLIAASVFLAIFLVMGLSDEGIETDVEEDDAEEGDAEVTDYEDEEEEVEEEELF
ncbi:hypothetical protein CAEBREN_06937 [Caenorhabditis brenneri]|uniref:Uncharacterized protein n=1 Tax=Caenorhabditis brenneri TaxID=135651 RepID=G0N1A6_CAEBE|nr:hypothetical protein CAEBREN_06937 [Caenorhabditis brenneri]